MRTKFAIAALASAVAACQHTPRDLADRGVNAANVPVVTRTDYAADVAASGGYMTPEEQARLDAWFAGLGLGYGDTIYVDGPYAGAVRDDVARVAGKYGLMVSQGAPITAGAVAPGAIRVVVSRSKVDVPGCPNWSTPSHPNYNNRTMSNYGCSVNGNLAAMVANPQDLVYGREGPTAIDAVAGAKAINMYRDWPLTGIKPGQELRPFKSVEDTTTTKSGSK